jgi:hypothetical protein
MFFFGCKTLFWGIKMYLLRNEYQQDSFDPIRLNYNHRNIAMNALNYSIANEGFNQFPDYVRGIMPA